MKYQIIPRMPIDTAAFKAVDLSREKATLIDTTTTTTTATATATATATTTTTNNNNNYYY